METPSEQSVQNSSLNNSKTIEFNLETDKIDLKTITFTISGQIVRQFLNFIFNEIEVLSEQFIISNKKQDLTVVDIYFQAFLLNNKKQLLQYEFIFQHLKYHPHINLIDFKKISTVQISKNDTNAKNIDVDHYNNNDNNNYNNNNNSNNNYKNNNNNNYNNSNNNSDSNNSKTNISIKKNELKKISTSCHARIGLMGNPSDGFNGKTLSFLIENFKATVTIEEVDDCCGVSNGVEIVPNVKFDVFKFKNLENLNDFTVKYVFFFFF
jgi:hypothetical protein